MKKIDRLQEKFNKRKATRTKLANKYKFKENFNIRRPPKDLTDYNIVMGRTLQ